MTLLLVKAAHVILALTSVTGFALRGWWMLRRSPLLLQRWVRVAPHVLDSLLLLSGLTLAFGWRISPLDHPWFAAKLVAVLVYIVAGSIALRRGRTPAMRLTALIVALVAVGYVIMAATTKLAAPPL